MKANHRHWRAVRRGRLNPATFDVRNRKAEKQFDRWWNSQLVYKVEFWGTECWELSPRGRGLIHKGRKP